VTFDAATGAPVGKVIRQRDAAFLVGFSTDGARLTIASLIRPGWILHMPRDAYGPGIETASEAAASRA